VRRLLLGAALVTAAWVAIQATPGAAAGGRVTVLSLGPWTLERLDALIRRARIIEDAGARVAYISKRFLGTPYAGQTLRGGPDTPEELVVDLEEMDCFTYLDYVEALRLSHDVGEFLPNLRRVRYRGGRVDYRLRNHFFISWKRFGPGRVADVTRAVGGERTRSAVKVLNLREDGRPFLPGVETTEVVVAYIPSQAVDASVVARLKTGDYVGIYTTRMGLDVSHTGIFVREGGRTLLRHASSRKGVMKVVDDDFIPYVRATPGIVVLRPLPGGV